MTLSLSRSYPSRFGAPVISKVDTTIFRRRYFTRCSACSFCQDACCQYGVDVEQDTVDRILARADALEKYLGVPREEWFHEGLEEDPEMPGGGMRQTRVRDGSCVFHDPKGRGCRLHRFAVENGLDYHEIKPMVSTLFPITFAEGELVPSDEVEDGTLICVDQGPTLFEGLRDELRFYFGDAFVAELSELAANHGR